MPAKTPNQKVVSSLMGGSTSGGSGKQSSITSFFRAKQQPKDVVIQDASPGTPPAVSHSSPVKRSSVTPLACSTDALCLSDSLKTDDLLVDEEEIALICGSKKSRHAVVIDDEDEGGESQRSPLEKKKSQVNLRRTPAVAPSSPLALPKPAKVTPKPTSGKSLLSRPEDDCEDQSKGTEGRYAWLVDVKDANGNRSGSPEYDPRTLYIPPGAWAKFTPFEKQFWEIKSRLMDTVVFFKKGKFYELYEGDADVGAQLFDLKMTDRVNMRMVGVPEATFDWWAGKFVAAGHRIARVDQTETSISKGMKDREAKGTKAADKIIHRELSAILTAGTLVDPGLLTSEQSTFCLALKEEGALSFGLVFMDAATAAFRLCSINDDPALAKMSTLLMQIKPKEILLPKGRVSSAVLKLIKDLLPDSQLIQTLPDKEFWDARKTADEMQRAGYAKLEAPDLVLSAFGGLLWYLRELKLEGQLMSCPDIQPYDPIQASDRLVLDGQTLINLDVLPTGSTTRSGSLLGLLDRCQTPSGRRLLRFWVCHPLKDPQVINKRLDMVDWLIREPKLVAALQKDLTGMPDLERLLSRIFAGSVKVKDFILVLESLQKLSGLFNRLRGDLDVSAGCLVELLDSLPEFEEPLRFFFTAFDHAQAKREGNVIPAAGVHAAFDGSEQEFRSVQQQLATYLKEQQVALKCPSLKYKDLGKELYQLEVPVAVKVPADFILMSKTKAVNRYWTATIKDLVRRFQEAEVRKSEALQNIFADLLKQFSGHGRIWRRVVMVLTELDCLLSLALCSAAMSEPKCRPRFSDPGEGRPGPLHFMDLRHPCIPPEREASFIPNTIELNGDDSRMVILTGPNMGGKSTLLRQTCLATIMAQIGCYVPAQSCLITPVDRIFTRLGANDNILAGQSTFMVELTETSRILHEATARSLVILDELGRGTSTFDGLAIAQAVLAYLIERTRCAGLFATHYRQLAVDYEGKDRRAACQYMACEADNVKYKKQITFLYKLTPGISPKSYGMNVAALAGIPREIIDEAEVIAEQFEACLSEAQKSHQQACSLKAADLFQLLLSC